MAHTPLTLTELLKINGNEIADVEIDELLRGAPFLAALPATTASNGTVHKYNKLTTEPTVGFRDLNDGRDHDHTERTTVTETLKILDATFHVDMAAGSEARTLEARSHLQSAFAKAERQIYYGTGTGGDASGFTGFMNSTNLDALADDFVIDGGGSTASSQTSVYVVRATPDATGVMSVFYEGGISIGDEYQTLMDGATGSFPAWVTPITTYMALQIGSKYSVARVANVESSLTDSMIYDAISQFKSSEGPTHVVMNRKALKLLRASRTATNAIGAPAPPPTDVYGVPVVVTDQLVNTEAVET